MLIERSITGQDVRGFALAVKSFHIALPGLFSRLFDSTSF